MVLTFMNSSDTRFTLPLLSSSCHSLYQQPHLKAWFAQSLEAVDFSIRFNTDRGALEHVRSTRRAWRVRSSEWASKRRHGRVSSADWCWADRRRLTGYRTGHQHITAKLERHCRSSSVLFVLWTSGEVPISFHLLTPAVSQSTYVISCCTSLSFRCRPILLEEPKLSQFSY